MPSTYTKLHFHLIFATKKRQRLISAKVRDPLYRYIGGVIVQHRGMLLEIGGVSDHIHLLVGLPATVSVAEAVKTIKGSSSRWVGKELGEVFGWQPGYAAFTVSESGLTDVRRYIERQPQHHREHSFDDEMRRLLHAHGITPGTEIFPDD